MRQITPFRCFNIGSAVLIGLLAMPVTGAAQEITGQARAMQATVLGMTTALADTGTLGGVDDAREASMQTGNIPDLGGAEILHAASVGSRDASGAPESVASEASLADLGLSVAGNAITADFVMARAGETLSGGSTAVSNVDGLAINGSPVAVTGEPNQVVNLLGGGQVIINEQQATGTGGTVVNALHVVVDGVADVAIATASAGADAAEEDDTSLLGL